MEIYQNLYRKGAWEKDFPACELTDLVLILGDITKIYHSRNIEDIKSSFPNAQVVGCTTAGEVHNGHIYEDSISLSALNFNSSRTQSVSANINPENLKIKAQELAKQLYNKDLKSIFVIATGHNINGTELINGIKDIIPKEILITGGLAGDNVNFNKTYVAHNDIICDDLIVLVGFYGEDLIVASGCEGGWTEFGPERVVTKSNRNVLYSLDGIPALDIYKKYLGDKVNDLPASALLFPLVVKLNNKLITRTILDIDEKSGAMIFAGDIPENAKTQFMMASHNDLIIGAEKSALSAYENIDLKSRTGFLLTISCVGRKLVLNNYTEDEIEVIKDVFGDNWKSSGFYSYGELSPRETGQDCLLQNQTMTISAIGEKI